MSPAEPGEIVLTKTDQGVRIDSADDVIRISPPLLGEWHMAGNCPPEVTLGCARKPDCPVGDVFRVEAINRTVRYEVTRTDHGWLEGVSPWSYVAETTDREPESVTGQ